MKSKLLSLIAFLVLGFGVVTPALAVEEYVEVPECVEVSAPYPVEFSANVAKIGTINATFKWFEGPEGTWTLKMDKNPIGGVEDWVSSYPAGWHILFKKPVDLPQTIVEVNCPEPEEPEEPVEETPGLPGNPPTFQGSTTEAPQCGDVAPLKVMANFHVVRNGVEAEIKWIPTEGSKAHIYFREDFEAGWKHALRDTNNNGGATIRDLHADRVYQFAGQQVNGCAGGPLTSPVEAGVEAGLYR